MPAASAGLPSLTELTSRPLTSSADAERLGQFGRQRLDLQAEVADRRGLGRLGLLVRLLLGFWPSPDAKTTLSEGAGTIVPSALLAVADSTSARTTCRRRSTATLRRNVGHAGDLVAVEADDHVARLRPALSAGLPGRPRRPGRPWSGDRGRAAWPGPASAIAEQRCRSGPGGPCRP